MGQQHRIELDGQRINYTCENSGYRTDLNKGETHADRSPARGSVFPEPLASREGGYSLWLEHVVDKKTGDEYYWLMWYDANGYPTIPLSGILSRADIAGMQRLLTSFIP